MKIIPRNPYLQAIALGEIKTQTRVIKDKSKYSRKDKHKTDWK